MRGRIDNLPNSERNIEQKKLRNEVLARRASTGILISSLALGLTGCEREDYYGTIEETRDVLGDSTIPECLDGKPYDLYGDGAKWDRRYSGEHHHPNTNTIVTITPEAGGETLILEQTMLNGSRPMDLVASPYTDMELLKEAGCDPADIPEHIISYDIEDNTKQLKKYLMIPPPGLK